MKNSTRVLAGLLLPAAALAADDSSWKPLLDAKLSQFDVYLSYPGTDIMDARAAYSAPIWHKSLGLNPPGQKEFSVVQQEGRPVLRISGEIYGCVQTRESFSNYHLRLETRWGTKKSEPRLKEPRNSGILYHSRGDFGADYWKTWAMSHDFEVIEHEFGAYWTVAGTSMDIRVAPKASGEEAPRWNPAAAWTEFDSRNNHALPGSDEERPGQWNRLEIICFQDDCVHVVNGKVVMALANARYREDGKWIPMTGGKLQIQSEAAEVYYRNIEIRAIAAMPAEYRRYFQGD